MGARVAVSLPGTAGGHRTLYLCPPGWSKERAEQWARGRDHRWESIWIIPLLDAEADDPLKAQP